MFFNNILSYDMLDDMEENIARSEINTSSSEDTNECCICLEKYLGNSKTKATTISNIIKHNPSIIKQCNCSYVVHNECFYNWFKNNQSCVICRENMNRIVIIHDIQHVGVSRYFIVRVTVKLINGILIANYTIYIIKTVYRTLATILIYSVFLFYLVNIIKKQYERITTDNIDIEYETLE
jgi:hypothetical protein